MLKKLINISLVCYCFYVMKLVLYFSPLLKLSLIVYSISLILSISNLREQILLFNSNNSLNKSDLNYRMLKYVLLNIFIIMIFSDAGYTIANNLRLGRTGELFCSEKYLLDLFNLKAFIFISSAAAYNVIFSICIYYFLKSLDKESLLFQYFKNIQNIPLVIQYSVVQFCILYFILHAVNLLNANYYFISRVFIGFIDYYIIIGFLSGFVIGVINIILSFRIIKNTYFGIILLIQHSILGVINSILLVHCGILISMLYITISFMIGDLIVKQLLYKRQ